MKITIIRHGKVDMKWSKWCTSKQFDFECCQYDEAALVPISCNDLQNDGGEEIYISTLKRSRITAEILFKRKLFIETELLNEVPLKSFCDCRIKLPLWLWNVIGRAEWLLQCNRQPEGRSMTEQRADKVIQLLGKKNKDCILVSHGFFMRTLIRRLESNGFTIDKKKLGFANLEKVTAYK